MLKTFFEIGQDTSLFEGLAIKQTHRYCKRHQNKYPVVFIRLKGTAGATYKNVYSMIK